MTECSCERCQAACSHKPGWFLPDQIKPLADHLGLTEQELFDQHLLVDWVDMVDEQGKDNDEQVFVLSPALKGKAAGTNFPSDPRGVCHWFVDGKCSIHPFKPFECADYAHDEPKEKGQHVHRHVVPKAWLGHQTHITELLGEEPDTNEWGWLSSILDVLTPVSSAPIVDAVWNEDLCKLTYDEVVVKAKEMYPHGCFVKEISGHLLESDKQEVVFYGLNYYENGITNTNILYTVDVSAQVGYQFTKDLREQKTYVNS